MNTVAKQMDLNGRGVRVVHHHVRKTAGTSLNAAFWDLGGLTLRSMGKRSRVRRRGLVFQRHKRKRIEAGDYFFANSHAPVEELALQPDTFTVTVLRDPLRRLVSHYRYLRYLRDDQHAPLTEPYLAGLSNEIAWVGADFGEFLDRVPHQHALAQLGTFDREDHVQRAVERVLKCDAVCFTETFSADLAELAATLSLPLREMHERRMGTDVDLSDAHRARALTLLQPEYAFIEQACAALGRPTPAALARGSAPAPIAVLGLPRGGTSAVSGVLQQLGVAMGDRLKTSGSAIEHPTYEDARLRALCRQAYDEPSPVRLMSDEAIVEGLKAWFRFRADTAVRAHAPIGAKHPLLMAMVPELVAAAPDVRLVRIDRPVAASIASLRKRGWWNPDKSEVLCRTLHQQGEAALQGRTHHRLSYGDLVKEPSREVHRLIDALQLQPSASQIAAAIRSIDPSLRHFR